MLFLLQGTGILISGTGNKKQDNGLTTLQTLPNSPRHPRLTYRTFRPLMNDCTEPQSRSATATKHSRNIQNGTDAAPPSGSSVNISQIISAVELSFCMRDVRKAGKGTDQSAQCFSVGNGVSSVPFRDRTPIPNRTLHSPCTEDR